MKTMYHAKKAMTIAALMSAACALAFDDVQVTYRGRVRENGAAPTVQTVSMTFRLYAKRQDARPTWTMEIPEVRIDTNGLFQVALRGAGRAETIDAGNAGRIGVDLIATFLPDDVVDGLYKACERAGLAVANLTLEPIAAIEIAIPEKFRMLNLALVDVGAGTSDICITDDGTIIAYGMLPIAGDHLTEVIARHCLVDFNTGDDIKVRASKEEVVKYTDIMGLDKSLTSKEILAVAAPAVDDMAKQVSDEIRRLNGGEPVSAVFIVGGGGKIEGYAEAIAKYMELPEERVALRGEEVMRDIIFMSNDGIERDSRMVTPLGICMSYYASNNNFIFVFNTIIKNICNITTNIIIFTILFINEMIFKH